MRRAILLGAAAGVAGGLMFGAAMGLLGMLPTVASMVRADSPYVGFGVHMAIAALVGAGFGLFVRGQRSQPSETLFWGLAYGAFWWFLGPQTLLPVLLGRPVTWDLADATRLFPSLIGHLYYGATTALVFAALHRDPWARAARARAGTLLRGGLAGLAAVAILSWAFGPGPEPLITGPSAGLVHALLFGRRREGTGVALVRGAAYGFLCWIAVDLTVVPLLRDGSLGWSAAMATDRLPAYILLGALTTAAFGWLGGIHRALFVDDVRLPPGEGPGVASLRATAYGALAGLLGGLVFTGVMVAVDALPTVAGLVGGRTAKTGLIVHLVIAQLIGVSYALLFRRLGYDLVSGVGWGMSYGFLWWVLGGLTLLPVLLGGVPQWNAGALSAAFPSLIGHLAYGAVLGGVHQYLEQRTNPWWLPRDRLASERAAVRREQALGSAPALWTLTIMIALTVPLLLRGAA